MFWRDLERKMAGRLKLLKTLASLLLLLSVCKSPTPHSSSVDGLYTPLMLASTTSLLFAGDVDISTLARPGILAGLVVMVCLRVLVSVTGRMTSTCIRTMSWLFHT